MTTRKKTGTVAFRPRARLLKLIGAELISDEVVAVSELVKNAHDADALGVTIAFRGVTEADGEIDIRDDGLGMSLETVLGRRWSPRRSQGSGSLRECSAAAAADGRRTVHDLGANFRASSLH